MGSEGGRCKFVPATEDEKCLNREVGPGVGCPLPVIFPFAAWDFGYREASHAWLSSSSCLPNDTCPEPLRDWCASGVLLVAMCAGLPICHRESFGGGQQMPSSASAARRLVTFLSPQLVPPSFATSQRVLSAFPGQCQRHS